MLKSAYRGGDIEWWDEEEEEVKEASGDYYGEYTDDEDGFSDRGDIDEGSGEPELEQEDYDDIIVPAWTQEKEKERVDQKWDPWVTDSPATTVKPVSGGTSSVHLKNKFALMRAVITYIMPVATCYFGAFLTDSPWIFQ